MQCTDACGCDVYRPLLEDFRLMRTMLSLLDLSRDRLALLSLVRVLEHANPEKLFAMLERLAMDEVNHYRGDSHLLLRDNQSPSTKFFDVYIQDQGSSLTRAVSKVLAKTFDKRLPMEVNPSLISDETERLQNMENIKKVVIAIKACVLRRVKRFPLGLAALCSVLNSQQILACAAEEPPIPDSIDEQEQSPRSLVGCSIVATVVFLKLICPHICKREAFEGSAAGCVPSLRENTVLVKILQRAANNATFEESSHLSPLNPLIREYHSDFQEYAQKILARGATVGSSSVVTVNRDPAEARRDWAVLYDVFRKRFTALQQSLLLANTGSASTADCEGQTSAQEAQVCLSEEEDLCTLMVSVRNAIGSVEANKSDSPQTLSSAKKKRRRLERKKRNTITSLVPEKGSGRRPSKERGLDAILSPRSSSPGTLASFSHSSLKRLTATFSSEPKPKLTPYFQKDTDDTDRLLAHCTSEKDLRKLARESSERDLGAFKR